MEILKCSDLSFSYSNNKPILQGLSFSVQEGDFVLLAGLAGSGKSTLLRLLKREINPHGNKGGSIYFDGRDMNSLSDAEAMRSISYVGRDNMLTAEYVYSQLAFPLESLNMPQGVIRLRLAELCGEFGLSGLFRRRIAELSAGERQRVAIAAALAANPRLLLLDEPIAMLDPISAFELLDRLQAYQQRNNMTIIVAEHNIAGILKYCDSMMILEQGCLKLCGDIEAGCRSLTVSKSPLAAALPAIVRIFYALGGEGKVPMSSSELRRFLLTKEIKQQVKIDATRGDGDAVLTARSLFYKYSRDGEIILDNVSLELKSGCCTALLGANGSGKSTLLRLLAALHKPLGGKVKCWGSAYILPQQAGDIFTHATLIEEFNASAPENAWRPLAERFGLIDLLDAHYLDLSAGELQKSALLRILLKKPAVLLLDEPTVGLDIVAKEQLARILKELAAAGMAICFATHDIDFAAHIADECLLLFDKTAGETMPAREFFLHSDYYTTQTAAAVGELMPAVCVEEVLDCFADGSEGQ